jgi:hypothetical protein
MLASSSLIYNRATGNADFIRDFVKLWFGTTGKEDPGSFARKSASDCPPNRAAGAIDHCNLVLQQHSKPSLSPLLPHNLKSEMGDPGPFNHPYAFQFNWFGTQILKQTDPHAQ